MGDHQWFLCQRSHVARDADKWIDMKIMKVMKHDGRR